MNMGLPLPTTQPTHQQPGGHLLDKHLYQEQGHGQGQGQGQGQGLEQGHELRQGAGPGLAPAPGPGLVSGPGPGPRQGNQLVLEHIDTIVSVARRHSAAEAVMYAKTDAQVITPWGSNNTLG